MHAYADPIYDRSSLHLAGHAIPLVAVASDIIQTSIHGLLTEASKNIVEEESSLSKHPFVGIVDHVSVMPLDKRRRQYDSSNNEASIRNDENDDWYSSPSASAAQDIGKSMEKLGVNVYYYGNAHPERMSLAQVRRHYTPFFQSGGGTNEFSSSTTTTTTTYRDTATVGMSTVGAPPEFVENYNVRIRSDKKTARSLTRTLRERDGGLPGVEALTLPYGEGRYEVACNLLCPNLGSVDAIDSKLKEWATERVENEHVVLEKAYRVGTTVDQCLEALRISNSGEESIKYDAMVLQRFKDNILDNSY